MKKGELSFPELLRRVKKSGLETKLLKEHGTFGGIASLPERVRAIEVHLRKYVEQKSTGMLFFVMYDIEDNKVRNHVAKYLIKQGCTRVQKSIFLGNASLKRYHNIADTLREVNAMYQNGDSIMVLPVTKDSMTQLSVIGKDLDYRMVVSPPNVLII
jgi:CRISPR-associated endonuclease Cas2